MNDWTIGLGMAVDKAALSVEMDQCGDSGRDLTPFTAELAELMDAEPDAKWFLRAGRLLDRTARRRPKTGWPYREPSDLERIRKARRRRPRLPAPPIDEDILGPKALGGWLGRAAGCLLGKVVEGRRRGQIAGYLQAQGRWPLREYFSNAADESVRQQFGFRPADARSYAENIHGFPPDDDLNYTVAAMAIVDAHGAEFTPADVARFWLGHLPILRTYTAERTACRNLVAGVAPPGADGAVAGRFSSATFRNPYREWIGAQIRADLYGYICPGDPARAAEYAWRDACVSHVANRIYGSMWVAAMLAAAYVAGPEIPKVLRAGLGEIPARSRLHEAVIDVLAWRQEGIDYAAAVDRIHARWDEANRHHWCHTISNAQIVAAALLWGEMDFTRTICGAVEAGFDTDCNGATAGSVLGVMLGGGGAIGYEWTDPLADTLRTDVAGYQDLRISQLAGKTVELIERCRPAPPPAP